MLIIYLFGICVLCHMEPGKKNFCIHRMYHFGSFFFCCASAPKQIFFLYMLVTFDFPISEGDAYFTVKLQDYTAVEKDDVILDCELSRDVPVKWYHNDNEIKASKVVTMKAEGKRRILSIKRVADKDKGSYMCNCGTDKTMANITIEGK